MTTDQKGAIAEACIAAAAIKLGVGVFRPLADERYDLIFDFGLEAAARPVQMGDSAQRGV